MADNDQNTNELTQQQKQLILQLFKKGIYKDKDKVNTFIRTLSSLWGIDFQDDEE